MITIKSRNEIEKMKAAGEIVSIVLRKLEEVIKPGIKTLELDKLAEEIMRARDSSPSFKGYRTSMDTPAFPASICTSINDEVVHGIPNDTILNEGDIVSIDVGTYKNGMHADAARSYAVGAISDNAKRLIAVAKSSFFSGIRMAVEGKRLGNISSEIQKTVEENGFSVVRDLVGHGIGRDLHEDPQIPNFATSRKGVRLLKGMTLAIEPMINYGGYKVTTKGNHWTIVTLDGSLSAHYENTIIVTNNDPLIITI